MYIIYISLVCILLLNEHICQIPIPCVWRKRRDEEEEENIDDNGGGGSVKNDDDDDDDNNNDNNKNNNSREGSNGLDINEVLSIHRQSKPKAHKHLHMFINDYYQPDAGVNHDSHHLYLHKLDKNGVLFQCKVMSVTSTDKFESSVLMEIINGICGVCDLFL